MQLNEQINHLSKLVEILNQSIRNEEAASQVIEMAREMFNCSSVAVLMMDEHTEDLRIRISRGISHLFMKEYRRPLGSDIMVEVVRTQRPFMSAHVPMDSEFYQDLKLEHDYSSVMLAPVCYAQNSIGILYACSPEPEHFSATDRQLFGILGHMVGMAVQKERLMIMARKLTPMDEKCGIFTYDAFREHLADEVKQAKEFHFPISLVLFDIDHYKSYREINGAQAGDDLFKEIILIMRKELPAVAMIGRHGTDEFIVCLPHRSLEETTYHANQILQTVAHKTFAEGDHVTLSAGICTAGNTPEADDYDLISLMNRVHLALLKAQRNGRNCVTIAD